MFWHPVFSSTSCRMMSALLNAVHSTKLKFNRINFSFTVYPIRFFSFYSLSRQVVLWLRTFHGNQHCFVINASFTASPPSRAGLTRLGTPDLTSAGPEKRFEKAMLRCQAVAVLKKGHHVFRRRFRWNRPERPQNLFPLFSEKGQSLFCFFYNASSEIVRG